MMYRVKPEYLDMWGNETCKDTMITEDDLEMIARGWEMDVDELKDQLVEVDGEAKPISVQFEAGEGRYFHGGVNFLLSADYEVYAECLVPEGASDDYGYLTMVNALHERFGSLTGYTFWYDGKEKYLSEDASADCEVFTDCSIYH